MSKMKKAPKSPKRIRKKNVKTTQLPQYNVILYDDDKNTGNDVVDRIMSIIPHFSGEEGESKAIECVREAHEQGRAFLVTVHKERAEFYVAQFAACKPPIKVTAEPCT